MARPLKAFTETDFDKKILHNLWAKRAIFKKVLFSLVPHPLRLTPPPPSLSARATKKITFLRLPLGKTKKKLPDLKRKKVKKDFREMYNFWNKKNYVKS